jgi:GGDEF domain-containing protein
LIRRNMDHIAQRIMTRLSELGVFEGNPCQISVSISLTSTMHHGQPSAQSLMADADFTLYSAKRKGRWQV